MDLSLCMTPVAGEQFSEALQPFAFNADALGARRLICAEAKPSQLGPAERSANVCRRDHCQAVGLQGLDCGALALHQVSDKVA